MAPSRISPTAQLLLTWARTLAPDVVEVEAEHFGELLQLGEILRPVARFQRRRNGRLTDHVDVYPNVLIGRTIFLPRGLLPVPPT